MPDVAPISRAYQACALHATGCRGYADVDRRPAPRLRRRDDGGMAADEDRMREIIRSSAWLMRVLEIVRRAGLPDAWVGAGVVRDLVWRRNPRRASLAVSQDCRDQVFLNNRLPT